MNLNFIVCVVFLNEIKELFEADLNALRSVPQPNEVLAEGPHEHEPLVVLAGEGPDDHLLLQGYLVVGGDDAGQLLLLLLERDLEHVRHQVLELLPEAQLHPQQVIYVFQLGFLDNVFGDADCF